MIYVFLAKTASSHHGNTDHVGLEQQVTERTLLLADPVLEQHESVVDDENVADGLEKDQTDDGNDTAVQHEENFNEETRAKADAVSTVNNADPETETVVSPMPAEVAIDDADVLSSISPESQSAEFQNDLSPPMPVEIGQLPLDEIGSTSVEQAPTSSLLAGNSEEQLDDENCGDVMLDHPNLIKISESCLSLFAFS